MFDSYREKTPGEVLQSRAAYPRLLALLIVCGLSAASLFSHHLPLVPVVALYCVVFGLLGWSVYLQRRGKGLMSSDALHT